MKIGILTFHAVPNFGAALQAFALQSFLQSEGHEPFIIDYRPAYPPPSALPPPPSALCPLPSALRPPP